MIEYSRRKLTDLLLRFSAATENQLRSYFNFDSHDQIFTDLKARYFDSEEVELSVANEAGSFERRKVLVFFITEKYRKELKKDGRNVKVYKSYLASPWRLDRLHHELLVLETFIYLTKRYGQELAYLTERELKQYGENSADLRIYYLEDDEQKEVDCEIVVKNHRHQISSKSNNMLYFTPLQSKKDFIDEAKKTDSTLINLDLSVNENSIKKYKLTALDNEIIDALTFAMAPINASAVAAILGKDRGYIVPFLNNLVDERHIFMGKVQLENKKGNKIYSRNEYDVISLYDRMFGILYSKSICKLVKTDSKIIKVDADNHIFITENAAKAPANTRRIYYVDGLKSVAKELNRFERVKVFAAKCDADFLFIASSRDRFLEIKNIYREPNVYLFRTQCEAKPRFCTLLF